MRECWRAGAGRLSGRSGRCWMTRHWRTRRAFSGSRRSWGSARDWDWAAGAGMTFENGAADQRSDAPMIVSVALFRRKRPVISLRHPPSWGAEHQARSIARPGNAQKPPGSFPQEKARNQPPTPTELGCRAPGPVYRQTR